MFLSVASRPASDRPDAAGGGARPRSLAPRAAVWRNCFCVSLRLSTHSVALEPGRAQQGEWPPEAGQAGGSLEAAACGGMVCWNLLGAIT